MSILDLFMNGFLVAGAYVNYVHPVGYVMKYIFNWMISCHVFSY